MPQYRAKVKCYVDNGIREADEVFEYNGPENGNLELVSGNPAAAEQAGEVEAKPQKGFARKAKADAV